MRKHTTALAATVALLVLCSGAVALGQAAGQKQNPFTGDPAAIKEGRALYIQHGCSGCHGVMGGGGMATPISDDAWRFGSSDEVLFRLIKGGIAESTMPKLWQGLADEQVWKILAYTRSVYTGDPSKADW